MAGGGASKYLANLPSRGVLPSSTTFHSSSNPGGMRVYICDRDTSPPEDQVIKTNGTNILIRSLTLKKQKTEAKGKAATPTTNAKAGKRAAEKPADGKVTVKKANIILNSRTSRQEGSSSSGRGALEKDFQGLTVEKLRAILKERGLSTKGKKDELIARLRGV